MKKIKASDFIVLNAINRVFEKNSNNKWYIFATLNSNIIPEIPKTVSIAKGTIYDAIRRLNKYKIIDYREIKWYCYRIEKTDLYEDYFK